MHLKPFYLNGSQLPLRFYDLPGISRIGTIGTEELNMVLNGEIRPNTEVIIANYDSL